MAISFVTSPAMGVWALGTLDWLVAGTPWKVMLLTPQYLPAIATHAFVADAATYEVTGTGYVGGFGGAGRLALTRTLVEQSDGSVLLAADDLQWPALDVGVVGAAALIYERTSDADSNLVAVTTRGFPQLTSGAALDLLWPIAGPITLADPTPARVASYNPLIYRAAKRRIGRSLFGAWTGATPIGVLLVNPTYTPDPYTHEYVSQLATYEITAAGYARQTLAGRTVVQDGDVVILGATDTTFPLFSDQAVGGLVLYQVGATDDVSPLIAFTNAGFPQTPTALDALTLPWTAAGGPVQFWSAA